VTYEFKPNYRIPPGVTILETIDYLHIPHDVIASKLGIPGEMLSSLFNGALPLTNEVAYRLEDILDIPASLLINMEKNYRSKE